MGNVPRWLELVGEIDYWVWVLESMLKERYTRTGIEKLIDEATGMDSHLEKRAKYIIGKIRKLRKEYDSLANGTGGGDEKVN